MAIAEKGTPISSGEAMEHGRLTVASTNSSRRPLYCILLAGLAIIATYVSLSRFDGFRCFQVHTQTADTTSTIAQEPTLVRRDAAANTTTAKLVDFQVYPPVLTPYSPENDVVVLTNGSSAAPFETNIQMKSSCVVNQTLMAYDFAYSYGHPFVGQYTPPKCSFNRVTFNFTVTSAGRQFDRLAIMYLGSTEIWRTSTAEPTSYGIVWTYIKDVSEYVSLFQTKQTIIFDLGNLIDSTYTGIYNTTLTATFWTAEDTVVPADEIIPISNGNGVKNESSVFTVPSDVAIGSVKIPKRTNRAVFSIAATGQIGEEFWYTNLLTSDVNTFNSTLGPGAFYGSSPFREVQLYIDGILAGVVWPFPIIFTGGVVPGLWRPIVGIDTFDLKEEEIDITPWLPQLCDGQTHTFQIKIQGINDNGKKKGALVDAPSYWLVTGKIFLWFDPAGSVTTGSTISYNVPAPSITISQSFGQDKNGTNQTLSYSVDVSRHLTISSTVKTANGTTTASWKQTLSYSNQGVVSGYGYTQANDQLTTGTDTSSSGYKRKISYPIYLNSTFAYPNNGLYLYADVQRGQHIDITGIPTFPTGLQDFDQLPAVKASYPTFQGSSLDTTQNGTAYYFANATVRYSYGTTAQQMSFSGDQYGSATDANGFPVTQSSSELYSRYVEAVNTTVVTDQESLIGHSTVDFAVAVEAVPMGAQVYAGQSVKLVLGRGSS